MPVDAAAAILAAAGVGPHSRLCCALSGGVDSVALLAVLVRLRERFGYTLSAAHVHHGLSPAADHWRDFCAALCRRLEVPFSAFQVTVTRDHPAGLEAAARQARHGALADMACDWLVFGHHLDDQAETLLFRLFRGTGMRGAGAMAAIEPAAGAHAGHLRPLLGVTRAQLLCWAQAHQLDWVEDESNQDCRYARNDIRHRILPAIALAFPAAAPALARAARHFREASDLLDELAAEDEATCGGTALDRAAVLALSDARIVNLLRWQARRRGVPTPGSARVREVLRQLRTVADTHPLYFPFGEVVCCAYRGRVWLEPALTRNPIPLAWGGGMPTGRVLPWGEGSVVFHAVHGAGIGRQVLDQAAVCRLHGRGSGLRLRLAPERPRRSLKNLCQEAGIPAWMRDRLPVLEIDGVAAWVGGIGVDAAFACAPEAAGILPEWVQFSS